MSDILNINVHTGRYLTDREDGTFWASLPHSSQHIELSKADVSFNSENSATIRFDKNADYKLVTPSYSSEYANIQNCELHKSERARASDLPDKITKHSGDQIAQLINDSYQLEHQKYPTFPMPDDLRKKEEQEITQKTDQLNKRDYKFKVRGNSLTDNYGEFYIDLPGTKQSFEVPKEDFIHNGNSVSIGLSKDKNYPIGTLNVTGDDKLDFDKNKTINGKELAKLMVASLTKEREKAQGIEK